MGIDNHLAGLRRMRIGLIADTHMPGTIAKLWPQVHDAFADADCILHAGDLHVVEVIDELESLAPTFVCSGNGDVGVEHARLKPHWVGKLAGVDVGLVHKFPTPRRADDARLQRTAGRIFAGVDPAVVVYGHTHLAEMHSVDGRVYVNPGSPTLPNNQLMQRGTIGFLEIGTNSISVELHQLREDGLCLLQRQVWPRRC